MRVIIRDEVTAGTAHEVELTFDATLGRMTLSITGTRAGNTVITLNHNDRALLRELLDFARDGMLAGAKR